MKSHWDYVYEEGILAQLEQYKTALRDMLFAYTNKDADCPHQFEIDAVWVANELLKKESDGE